LTSGSNLPGGKVSEGDICDPSEVLWEERVFV
jgi:hypothetical protein